MHTIKYSMSYCRFGQSDIYAYESNMGFIIHTAKVYPKDRPPTIFDFVEKYGQEVVYNMWKLTFPREPHMIDIDLPFAGESFVLETIEEFYDKMVELHDIGYKLQHNTLKRIKEEMEDGK